MYEYKMMQANKMQTISSHSKYCIRKCEMNKIAVSLFTSAWKLRSSVSVPLCKHYRQQPGRIAVRGDLACYRKARRAACQKRSISELYRNGERSMEPKRGWSVTTQSARVRENQATGGGATKKRARLGRFDHDDITVHGLPVFVSNWWLINSIVHRFL